jgi:hypothetical protein
MAAVFRVLKWVFSSDRHTTAVEVCVSDVFGRRNIAIVVFPRPRLRGLQSALCTT